MNTYYKESFQISVNSATSINGMKLVQTSASVSNINVEFLQEHNIMVNGIPVPDYADENVSTKVVKLIQSYTGVVNKMVWRKA